MSNQSGGNNSVNKPNTMGQNPFMRSPYMFPFVPPPIPNMAMAAAFYQQQQFQQQQQQQKQLSDSNLLNPETGNNRLSAGGTGFGVPPSSAYFKTISQSHSSNPGSQQPSPGANSTVLQNMGANFHRSASFNNPNLSTIQANQTSNTFLNGKLKLNSN
jgi:hypothetical protein